MKQSTQPGAKTRPQRWALVAGVVRRTTSPKRLRGAREVVACRTSGHHLRRLVDVDDVVAVIMEHRRSVFVPRICGDLRGAAAPETAVRTTHQRSRRRLGS